VGLIAPHLDYARGAPCYAAAYRDLVRRCDAERFVILGTNHFGLSRSVVGTRQDFETPWGNLRCDKAFMDCVDGLCGTDLCAGEYDHVREHSIELQSLLLKHLAGARDVAVAPFLCPDVCGPGRAAEDDDGGVDVDAFVAGLRGAIDGDDVPTCVIAGADLSHVGRFFQDDRDLDADNLHSVEASDREALERLVEQGGEPFRQYVRANGNGTNICSTGCIYALAKVLEGRAHAKLLHYHQAVTQEAENCVTCCAVEFIEPK
jgi:AmmeMemoRadiSam system protein B